MFTIELFPESIFIDIDREIFFEWIQKEGRNVWCNDFPDAGESDGHGQKTGEYSMDEYYEHVTGAALEKDIKAYLKTLL